MVRQRSFSRREDGNDGSGFGNGIEQSRIGPRIVDVDAGSDERDRPPSGIQGRDMGCGIYSRRTARDDGHPPPHEITDEPGSNLFAVCRCFSRSYDGDGNRRIGKTSPHVQYEGPAGHAEKRLRIFRIGFQNQPGSNGFHFTESRSRLVGSESARNLRSPFRRDVGSRENAKDFGRGRFETGGPLRKFARAEKEAEFAVGGSGRMQPDQRGFRHGDSKEAG